MKFLSIFIFLVVLCAVAGTIVLAETTPSPTPYPLDTSYPTYSPPPSYTPYPSYSPSPSYTPYPSCTQALIDLLGTDCHQMYTDTSGNLIYCDGPMTKSAKVGDTVTTPGCSYSGGPSPSYTPYPSYSPSASYTPYPSSSPSTSCTQTLIDLLGVGCHQMYTDASGNLIYCDGSMTKSAKVGDTTTTPGCSSSGNPSGSPIYTPYPSYSPYVTVTPTPTSTLYGACLIRNIYTNIPNYFWSDLGAGYAKSAKSGATTVIDLQKACTASDFSNLLKNYCTLSSNPIQEQVVVYDNNGYNQSSACGAYGCDYHYCPYPTYTPYPSPSPSYTPYPSYSPYPTSSPSPTEFFVMTEKTYPYTNSVDIDVNMRIQVKFSSELDQDSLNTQFLSLYSTAEPDKALTGYFKIFTDGFEFTPAMPLNPNTMYVYKISNVKSKTGLSLKTDYLANFKTKSGVSIQGTLKGMITDESSAKPLSGAIVHIFTSDYSQNFEVRTDALGNYILTLPEGSFTAEVYAPYDQPDLQRPKPVLFGIKIGELKILNFQFIRPVKIITGAIMFSDGKPVIDAEVGAYAQDTGQWIKTFVDSNGHYTLRVTGGKFIVNIRPRDASIATWSWHREAPQAIFSADAISETREINFTVASAKGKLIVTALNPDGNPLPDVGITADTVSANDSGMYFIKERMPPEYRKTDSSGKAEFLLPDGVYFLRGYISPELGFSNPFEEKISVSVSAGVVEVRLSFKRLENEFITTITGSAKLDTGIAVQTHVWAWSEKGGFQETISSTDGKFSLKLVRGSKWHIGAGTEINGFAYKSSELTVDTQLVTALGLEIILSKVGTEALASSVSVSKSAVEQVVVQSEDGSKITVPARAAGSSGTINVQIKPTVEAPSQASARVIGTAYDLTIRDAKGAEVKQFQQDIEVVLPYNEKEIKAQGIYEDAIIPSYFDETIGTWIKIDNYTLDKEKNQIIARVKHLTRFAIVAAADITPPLPPTTAVATALSAGSIQLTWVNPTVDFHHAKIYRSQDKSTLGKIVQAEALGATYIDSAVNSNTLYYYTIRAVDAAGNESSNIDQVHIISAGTRTIPSTDSSTLLRNLTVGSKGNDVQTLQSLLISQGVYPDALITGYFGPLTKQAVIRLQEKYAAEILIPAGLTVGTGYVGPATRAKVNTLLRLPIKY